MFTILYASRRGYCLILPGLIFSSMELLLYIPNSTAIQDTLWLYYVLQAMSDTVIRVNCVFDIVQRSCIHSMRLLNAIIEMHKF